MSLAGPALDQLVIYLTLARIMFVGLSKTTLLCFIIVINLSFVLFVFSL